MTNPKKSSLELKHQLYAFCDEFIENRRTTIQNNISEIQESLTSETKSSAGDKHETGRAMLQLEREKAGHQLVEIEKLSGILLKINVTVGSKTIGLGSIVYTTQDNYFIAVSAGRLEVDSQSFFAISSNTPIGLLLLGKTVGEEVVFREHTIKILNVA